MLSEKVHTHACKYVCEGYRVSGQKYGEFNRCQSAEKGAEKGGRKHAVSVLVGGGSGAKGPIIVVLVVDISLTKYAYV